MKELFIKKAHQRGNDARKALLEQTYPHIFKVGVVPLDEVKIGTWYKVGHLISGCQGFDGIGVCVDESSIEPHGLYRSDDGVCLQQRDGEYWRVNGTFTLTKPLKINKK